MEKICITLILLFCCYISSQAQDFIVKHRNDTIRCKILDVNDDYIKYQIKSNDVKITASINRKYVSSYFIDDNYESEVVDNESNKEKKSSFRIAFAGGYGYKLGTVLESGDTKSDKMSKDLKSGYDLDGEIQFFFNERHGIALNVSSMCSSAQTNHMYIDGYGTASTYKETQRVTFVGPAFACRYDEKDWLFTGSVGLGALFYNVKMEPDEYSLTGSQTSFGMNLGIGAEYKISKHIGIGLKIGYILGSVNSINIESQKVDFDEPMSLSSFMIGGYLSFRTQ